MLYSREFIWHIKRTPSCNTWCLVQPSSATAKKEDTRKTCSPSPKLKRCEEIGVINMDPKRKTGSSHHRHHLPSSASATRILLKLHLEITFDSCWEWPTNHLYGMRLSFNHQCILCFQQVSVFSCVLMFFYTFITDISYIPETKCMFHMFTMVLPVSVNHDHHHHLLTWFSEHFS